MWNLTINRLESWVNKSVHNDEEWLKKDCAKIIKLLREFEKADDETRIWISIGTWNDEAAELFNRYGCSVYCTIDSIGEPYWSIGMPMNYKEYLYNKEIWKDTWR